MRDRTYFIGRYDSKHSKDFFFYGEYEKVEGEPDFEKGETGCQMLSTAPVPGLGALETYIRTTKSNNVINWNDNVDRAFRDNLQDSIFYEESGIKPLTAKQIKTLEERIPDLVIE